MTVLELERDWWRASTSKEAAIRERLAMTPNEYYLLLDALLDRPAALAHDPLAVRRLRRVREERRRRRAAPSSDVDLG